MSTLKVNKIRDTAGSADAIVLDPSGGAKIAGVCTATSFSGQIPAASIVGVCTSGLTKTGGFGGGKIVQVVSTTKTDQFSEDTANATYTAAALAATITPSSASNKILVSVNATASMETASRIGFGIFKAGSILVQGDADGSRTRVTSQADSYSAGRAVFIGGEFLDTAGGTSAITYDVRLIHGQGGTKFLSLNRSYSSSDTASYLVSTSTITLTEIEA